MYRSNYVCFDCRKTARANRLDTRCPNCGKTMVNVGYKWHSPKRKDIKGWLRKRKFYYAWKRRLNDRTRLLPRSLR